MIAERFRSDDWAGENPSRSVLSFTLQSSGDHQGLWTRLQIMKIPTELLWALIGLLLTIGATFWEAMAIAPGFSVPGGGLVGIIALNSTCQIGAVLLVGLLGGKNAGALSQIAYLLLGLMTPWKIFDQGGGWDYLRQPSFGYLLGFVPAAWVCGEWAFRRLPRLEWLAISSFVGLGTIHGVGLVYLLLSLLFGWVKTSASWLDLLFRFSIAPVPSQIAIACAVSLLAYVLRRLMFY
jgi:biotin transport system substrate-specific component